MSEEYDCGCLSDYGGGKVGWWQDYIRSEVRRANDFNASAIESLESELAALKEENERLKTQVAEQNQELVPAGKPDRITEQDVRDIATGYCHWKSVGFYNTWFSEKGRELLNKLNADREQVPTVAVPDEEVAKMFHESYEKLAPSFGYETREETRKEWEAVPPNNKALMIAVIKQIRLALLTPSHSQQSVGDLPSTWHESDLSGGWADSCNQDSKEAPND